MSVNLIDHSDEVLAALKQQTLLALNTMGDQAATLAHDLAPYDTHNLQNSISYKVIADEKMAYVGTNVKYGVYQEFGTGKYYPGGRQTPWGYTDLRGEKHWTWGNRPHPFLKPAVADNSGRWKLIWEDALKG